MSSSAPREPDGAETTTRLARLTAFNERHAEEKRAREEHRQKCLRAAFQNALMAGFTGCACAVGGTRMLRVKISDWSTKSFGLVLSFFMPYALAHEMTRGRCQRQFRAVQAAD